MISKLWGRTGAQIIDISIFRNKFLNIRTTIYDYFAVVCLFVRPKTRLPYWWPAGQIWPATKYSVAMPQCEYLAFKFSLGKIVLEKKKIFKL